VIKILNTRFSEDIDLEVLSNEVGLNPVYLSRLFKEQTGRTYKNYITAIRMERAKLLLKDLQKPVSQVAVEVGYNDANYFSEAFKKYQGVSPTEYRVLEKTPN
jgi:two-component system response regulator YesN